MGRKMLRVKLGCQMTYIKCNILRKNKKKKIMLPKYIFIMHSRIQVLPWGLRLYSTSRAQFQFVPFGYNFSSITKLTLWVFFSFGGGISRILRIACSGGSLKNGGSPSTISITIMPVQGKWNIWITTFRGQNVWILSIIMSSESSFLYFPY